MLLPTLFLMLIILFLNLVNKMFILILILCASLLSSNFKGQFHGIYFMVFHPFLIHNQAVDYIYTCFIVTFLNPLSSFAHTYSISPLRSMAHSSSIFIMFAGSSSDSLQLTKPYSETAFSRYITPLLYLNWMQPVSHLLQYCPWFLSLTSALLSNLTPM